MEPSSPFQEIEDGPTLRLEWDNRHVRKDGCSCCFLTGFWIIWAPLTVFMTGVLLADEGSRWFLAIWLLFGWTGTLLIPYSFLGRTWKEWIEISEEGFCHGCEGFLAPKPKCFPLPTILYIFFGHYSDESIVTLSIFSLPGRFGFPNRHMFGGWLAPALKNELFDRIEAFIREQELPLQMNKGYHQ
jgi:hypothetical protein